MKTDKYTKVILTVIALCLTILTLQTVDVIPAAYAADGKYPLNYPVEEKKYAVIPLNSDGSIDVNIKSTSSEMDVNITNISTSDELDVNIDEVGGGYISHGGPISVRVD